MKKDVSRMIPGFGPVFRPVTAVVTVLALLGGLMLPIPARAGDFELGLRGYDNGDYALAVQYFRSALLRDGENPNIHYYLANALLKENRLAEAQSEFQRVMAMAPDSEAARMSRTGLARLRGYLIASFQSSLDTREDVSGSVGQDLVQGLSADGENYMDVIQDSGHYVRWSLTKMPLRLYVERSPQGIRNFEPAFIEQISKGLDTWVDALGHQISYTLVNEPQNADIRVFWTNGIDTTGNSSESGTTYTAGITVPTYDNNELKYMTIKIATLDVKGEPQTPHQILSVGTHELGHSLGLLGHSKKTGDVMYAQNEGLTELSKRDKNTIISLYSRVPDISNVPPGQLNKQPENEDDIVKGMDKDIDIFKGELAKSGTVLNYVNLANSYVRKAEHIKDKSPVEAQNLLQQGLDTINGAIKLEPKNFEGYLDRCRIYQKMQRPDDALADAEAAIRLAPKDPDAYLQKAWLMAAKGQPGEANNALDQYTTLDPLDANSPDVQRVRQRIMMNGQ